MRSPRSQSRSSRSGLLTLSAHSYYDQTYAMSVVIDQKNPPTQSDTWLKTDIGSLQTSGYPLQATIPVDESRYYAIIVGVAGYVSAEGSEHPWSDWGLAYVSIDVLVPSFALSYLG